MDVRVCSANLETLEPFAHASISTFTAQSGKNDVRNTVAKLHLVLPLCNRSLCCSCLPIGGYFLQERGYGR